MGRLDDRASAVGPASGEVLAGGGEMGALMRALDWAATPLGPVETWAQSLRTSVSICLSSRFPMLIWWGPELVMLYNDAYRPVLGATKHPAAMGQRGRECWPEIWDVIGPMLHGVLTAGEATWSDDQLLLLNRNGYVEECYFTFSYSPIRDESGGIGGVFTAVTETTGRVLGERRLRTLRELAARTAEARTVQDACALSVRALAGNPSDIPFALLYLLDAEGSRAHLLCAAGLDTGTPLSPPSVDLAADGGSCLPWPLARVARDNQAVLVQDLAARRDLFALPPDAPAPDAALVVPVSQAGQERPAAILVLGVNPRRALDDDYRAFFTLVAGQLATAIADAASYEEERRRAEALAALDRAKTAFFGNVSHEFRTPLTLLLGPLEEALAAPPDTPLATARTALETAYRNSLRLLRLVNTLLDFSRIEAGRVEASYTPTDLGALTTDVASAFRSAVQRAGLRLLVDCPPLPQPVYVDREMWEKIVLNLLSNALKFTFEGEIAVTLRPAGEHVELEVRDTGAGIPDEELPHLFERFHRVRGARARTQEGTGIGLALVQELVRLHGGTVGVTSEVGAGTTFTVTLPLGAAHLPPERINAARTLTSTAVGAAPFVEEAVRWLPLPPADEESADVDISTAVVSGASCDTPETDRACILVADDNADMRDYLTRLLGRRYLVRAAADGATALAAATAHPPDLVLSDVMMPEMDGLALLRALRADPRTQTVPVILLSARAGEEAAVEGLDAGADDYLIKPFSARELLARVQSHVALARLRRQVEEQRDAFLSSVSHDLKTPLTSIRGYAQLAHGRLTRSDGANIAGVVKNIESIESAAARMLALVNDLLEITRSQMGAPLPLDRRPTDLVALVRRLVAELHVPTSHHIVIEGAPKLTAPIDADRVERVLGNLLSNALKYSPEGGVVTVRIAREGGDAGPHAAVSVHDPGVGIPAADLPRIFERFHRGGNVVGHIEGTGVGLSSARQIVAAHGGTLTVESTEGDGSTFTVRLPLEGGPEA